MINPTQNINEAIKKQLHGDNFDLVDLLPLPAHGDRMVRLQTLEEIIEDFGDNENQEVYGFLLQVKVNKSLPSALDIQNISSGPESVENIYLSNGKLNVPFLSRNADILFGAGEFALARNIYKSILGSGELTGATLLKIGRCFEAENNWEEARINYEESIAFQSALEPYQRLSSLLIMQNRTQSAAEVLERALHLKELDSFTRFEIYKACGNCWTRAKKRDEAERNFKRALEIMPNADEIRSNLGVLYLQDGKVSESKRHFQDALASNPKSYAALAGLGSCALAEGEKKIAHDYFAQSLEIELKNPTAIFYLVKCAYEIKSYATAAKFLGEYIQIAPISANLLYSLAGLQYHLGRIIESKTNTLRVLELQPQHAGSQELLGMIEKYSLSSQP